MTKTEISLTSSNHSEVRDYLVGKGYNLEDAQGVLSVAPMCPGEDWLAVDTDENTPAAHAVRYQRRPGVYQVREI